MSIDLMPVPRQQFFDANGVPLAGGKLYFYSAGTSTPLATYTDISATILNSNPVILDSGGFATVWLGAGPYRVVLKDANDVQQWITDNVTSSIFGPATTDTLQNKILTGPSSNNNVTLLNLQTFLPALTQTGSDAVAAGFTIPANTVGTGKIIKVSVLFAMNGSPSPIAIKIKVGTQLVAQATVQVLGNGWLSCDIINLGSGNMAGFNSGLIFNNSIASVPGGTSTGQAVDLSVPQVIAFTANMPSLVAFNVLMFKAELIQ